MANKWWQSGNGVQQVFIQFDLESEFVLANIYIHFKSFPPAAMIIEKSSDYGRSWQDIAYFAANCEETFPNVPTRTNKFHEPICTSKYSLIESPKELVYRPLYGYHNRDPNLLARYFKLTNIRFNFTQLHMFGDNYLININDDQEARVNLMSKYYYAIREMRIIGTCFCNGHASRCVQADHIQYDEEYLSSMVHSRCQCEHNTYGHNCEKCLPLYNDLEWRPAENGRVNECRMCECNGHATSCHFSEARFRETNGLSGGVCNNCMHNTEGDNCERCKQNYYHDTNIPFTEPGACKRNFLNLQLKKK